MWCISGNLIGSQDVNVHLTATRGVTITGNYLYSGHRRNLLVEQSRNIVVGSNCFGHNPDYGSLELCTGIRFEESSDCNLSGLSIEDCQAGRHTVKNAVALKRQGLVELVRCRRMNLNGLQIFDGAPYGLFLEDCSETLVTGCSVLDRREQRLMKAAVLWKGAGAGNMITGSRLGSGSEGNVIAEPHVHQSNNRFDQSETAT
jgi:hypothetical protein